MAKRLENYIHKNIQKVKKQVKPCSTPSVIKEMQIKPQMR